MTSVYRASSVEHADIVVAWLDEQGISAFVKNRLMAGGYATLAIAPRGVEVCVVEPAEAEKAKTLLAAHDESLKKRRSGTNERIVRVLCSECGRLTDFAGELFGTVQRCPSCGGHVEVGEEPRYC